jgi:hypothetical protein
MRNLVEIENIEERRRQVGIDDVELREEIRGLVVGDVVKLTLLNGAKSFETVPVRITRTRGSAFRGKLASRTTSAGLSQLRVGSPVAFTAGQIHSVANRPAGQPGPLAKGLRKGARPCEGEAKQAPPGGG